MLKTEYSLKVIGKAFLHGKMPSKNTSLELTRAGTGLGMALLGIRNCSTEVTRQSPASQVAAGMLLSKQLVRKDVL